MYTHKYKFSSEKKKQVKSPSSVSRPEPDSDSPFGSDWESGCDMLILGSNNWFFCYYNMKLKIRNMEAETNKVAENNFLNLLEISAEFGEKEENQLF